MARTQQETCKRGHSLAAAYVTQTPKGIKRTCRICARERNERYYSVNPRPPRNRSRKPAAASQPEPVSLDTKDCGYCGKPFPRDKTMGRKRWVEQRFCSRECASKYLSSQPPTGSRAAPPTAASQSATNVHWQRRDQRNKNKALAQIAVRGTREDEVAAMQRFIEAVGVTRLPTPDPEQDPVRTTDNRPQFMAGWRG